MERPTTFSWGNFARTSAGGMSSCPTCTPSASASAASAGSSFTMNSVSVPRVTRRISRASRRMSSRAACFIRSWTIFTPARTAASAQRA